MPSYISPVEDIPIVVNTSIQKLKLSELFCEFQRYLRYMSETISRKSHIMYATTKDQRYCSSSWQNSGTEYQSSVGYFACFPILNPPELIDIGISILITFGSSTNHWIRNRYSIGFDLGEKLSKSLGDAFRILFLFLNFCLRGDWINCSNPIFRRTKETKPGRTFSNGDIKQALGLNGNLSTYFREALFNFLHLSNIAGNLISCNIQYGYYIISRPPIKVRNSQLVGKFKLCSKAKRQFDPTDKSYYLGAAYYDPGTIWCLSQDSCAYNRQNPYRYVTGNFICLQPRAIFSSIKRFVTTISGCIGRGKTALMDQYLQIAHYPFNIKSSSYSMNQVRAVGSI